MHYMLVWVVPDADTRDAAEKIEGRKKYTDERK